MKYFRLFCMSCGSYTTHEAEEKGLGVQCLHWRTHPVHHLSPSEEMELGHLMAFPWLNRRAS